MSKFVVAGSPASSRLVLANFSTTNSPGLIEILSLPTPFAGLVLSVDPANNTVAVADTAGSALRLYSLTADASSQGLSVLSADYALPYSAIAAVAVFGTRVAVSQSGGTGIHVADFSDPLNPLPLADLLSPAANARCLDFLDANTLLFSIPTAGADAKVFRGDISIPAAPTVGTFFDIGIPEFTGAVFALDRANGQLVVAPATVRPPVGNPPKSRYRLVDSGGGLLGQVDSAVLTSVNSLGLSNGRALALSLAFSSADRVDFGAAAVTSFDPQTGTSRIGSADGSLGACGGTTPNTLKLLDLAAVTPAVLGTSAAIPSFAAPGSLAVGMQPKFSSNAPSFGLSFGPVALLSPSALQSVTFSNSGHADLRLSGLATSDPQFAASSLADQVIAPGASVTLDFSFTPAALGTANASFSFNTNDPALGQVVQIIDLTGDGVPRFSAAPPALDFGTLDLNIASTLQSVTVSNDSSQVLNLTASLNGGGGAFSLAGAANRTIPAGPGTTDTFDISFTPSVLGPAPAASLDIVSTDADAGSLSVGLAGAGQLPVNALAPSTASLDFATVAVGTFLGLRLSVTNQSACPTVVLNPPAGFFITEGLNPIVLPPSGALQVDNWLAGTAKDFVVVFGPTLAGAAAGDLVFSIATAPAATLNPTPVTVALSGNAVAAPAQALVLVLDRSGSMGSSSGVVGQTRMQALHAAVDLFADLIPTSVSSTDRVGSVQFDNLFSVLTPLGTYTAGQQTALKSGASSLTPRGTTSIGGGIQTALTDATALNNGTGMPARQVLVVMTDGLENRAPLVASQLPLPSGVEGYAVALGASTSINTGILGDLASSSGGSFFLTDDPLVLRKKFVEVYANAFSQTVVTDPLFTLQAGQSFSEKAWITDLERSATFVLVWEDPQAQLKLEVRSPDGKVYDLASPAGNALVRAVQAPGYAFLRIAFPEIRSKKKPSSRPKKGLNGIVGPKRPGQWTLKATALAAGPNGVRATATVLADSPLKFKLKVPGKDANAALPVLAQLRLGKQALAGGQLTLHTVAPTKTLAKVLSKAVLLAVPAPAPDHNRVSAALASLSQGGRPAVPTKTTVRKAGLKRGPSLTLGASGVDGCYQFTATVTGKVNGQVYQRYASLTACLARTLAPSKSQHKVKSVRNGAQVMLTPKDAKGQPLGPGLAALLQPLAGKGTSAHVVDNLDGTYTLNLAWSKAPKAKALGLKMAGKAWPLDLKAALRPVRRQG